MQYLLHVNHIYLFFLSVVYGLKNYIESSSIKVLEIQIGLKNLHSTYTCRYRVITHMNILFRKSNNFFCFFLRLPFVIYNKIVMIEYSFRYCIILCVCHKMTTCTLLPVKIENLIICFILSSFRCIIFIRHLSVCLKIQFYICG